MKSLLVLLSLVVASTAFAQAPQSRVDASSATPKRANARFYELHAANLKRAKEPMGILFLGDSITEGWNKAPEVWQKYYGPWQPANFGIGGDLTQHVVWRIEDGELDGVKPKVVVLMLGTNNSGSYTGEEIAAADTKIVHLIQQKIPEAKILLLAIFPRGPRKDAKGVLDTGEQRMQVIGAANKELAKLDNGTTVRFLDIGPKFLDASGKIPDDVMPDQLHPNAKGYGIWADATQPLLEEMMR